MADLERFKFTVPGYTPETMPLDRLIEYLQQLSIILGQPGDLHLVAIERSSTRPVLAMRHDIAAKARSRAREAWQGGGSARRREAVHTIRRMVAQDGGEPAVLNAPEGKILEFPGADLGADQVVPAVRQQTTLQGELIRIGGVGEHAQLLIQELSGRVIAGCYTSRSLARDLAPLIYHPISVSGDGSWHRTEEGKWEVHRLKVQSFQRLDEDNHEDVVAKLRSLSVAWPPDGLEQITAMREQAA